MTTRKYPRTLNEAFPGGAEYASSLYVPSRQVGITRIIIGLALYGVCFAAMLMLMLAYFDVLVK